MSGVNLEATGMFCMSVVERILKTDSLIDAKSLAKDAIKNCTAKIKKENIRKAEKMIVNSIDQKQLAFGLSNFILAFQGERVIK